MHFRKYKYTYIYIYIFKQNLIQSFELPNNNYNNKKGTSFWISLI